LTGKKIDEVFIGSCMTNIGHFRAAGENMDYVLFGVMEIEYWLL